MLKSRFNFPAGGFKFYQPQTGWESSSYIGFDATVAEIIKHRKANPRFSLTTDKATVEQELDDYTTARLRSVNGGEQWITEGVSESPPVFTSRPRVRQPGVGVVAGASVKKIVAGVGLMLDFLGPSLKPVAPKLAEERAAICVGCDFNQPGGVIEEAGGEALRLLLEAKSELKLETSHDDKLKTCSLCSCRLTLKTHVPMDYILSKTPPEQMAAFPVFCWIKRRDKNEAG